jgi:hypothetical protein
MTPAERRIAIWADGLVRHLDSYPPNAWCPPGPLRCYHCGRPIALTLRWDTPTAIQLDTPTATSDHPGCPLGPAEIAAYRTINRAHNRATTRGIAGLG